MDEGCRTPQRGNWQCRAYESGIGDLEPTDLICVCATPENPARMARRSAAVSARPTPKLRRNDSPRIFRELVLFGGVQAIQRAEANTLDKELRFYDLGMPNIRRVSRVSLAKGRTCWRASKEPKEPSYSSRRAADPSSRPQSRSISRVRFSPPLVAKRRTFPRNCFDECRHRAGFRSRASVDGAHLLPD